ncbi:MULTISPECIES: peptidylprolyl isomerase [unclassified Sphingomonas]|jgi:peptidyl-prolyl cis-trans isomerase A (cyclophilin A)|uniref:peptidylprolyl isomerase n=1 Tax=unclassified Sphingomonas TaxID=196159 RepID=UPI000E109DAE|nr:MULTISPECIES: peptidylprolyl isomerase [unclassified Sphingomonas]AXJ94323.1 peptidylprolyl isomerase [Sphingomonas sp. FARSPH]
MTVRRALTALAMMASLPAAAQQQAAAPAVAPLPRVALDTTAGRIVIEADTQHAPVTAGNFLKYVDGKRLDGVVFYRAVKVAPQFGFVQFGTNGDPKRVLPPIKHEPTTQTGLHHTSGAISVARFEPGSARGDFTISVGDQSPSLDADPSKPGDNLGYAAFGHVVEGMDVVEKILDTPVSPTATVNGAFKGQVPQQTITVVTARRVPPAP